MVVVNRVVNLDMQRAAAMDGQTVVTPELTRLRQKYAGLSGQELLEKMIREEFPGQIAVVSSFGAESAVLLDLVARVDPTVPVIFLNTGKLFGETLRYRDRLQEKLGLTDLRSLHPHPRDLETFDPQGTLWAHDPDACCRIRKVLPLQTALKDFRASITGRKRFQTGARASMPMIEVERVEGGPDRFKVNPLAEWTLEDIKAYAEKRGLPDHPLVKDGYPSIGCMPCTSRVKPGGYREGRWAGLDKDECGIHSYNDGGGI
jgi:phosphoadenosine phosphosulfate reductase